MMVLSITSPGCQGEADQAKSEALAKRANDYMAEIVSKNPTRFQGFASVSMHNPAEAAQELTRAVKKLGLVGCMLNDCMTVQFLELTGKGQSSGPNGNVMLHYDSEKYDTFWKTVQDLDVPVYMHPRLASPTIQKQLWEGRPGWGPQIFSTGVSIHTLGLCGNGVFDRFPKVQFVIGHLGEGLPADIWRLDHCPSPPAFYLYLYLGGLVLNI
jgi:2,3-dihydroxybenzoate decarboxylase